MRNIPVRLAAALAVLCLATLAPAAAKSHDKPKLKLDVSAHHGRTPVEVKLTGRIDGLDPALKADCFIRVDWKNDTGVGLPFETRDLIGCPAMEPGDKMTFEKTVTAKKPGTYSYRILLKPKEGREMVSASREVKVIASTFEGRVTVGRGRQ